MTEVTYPYGYGSTRKTMAELEATATVRNAHKEYWRRWKAMLIAGKGRLGIGTMWRSSDVQRNTFLTRHYVVSSGGCCYFEGRRYQLKQGMAHAAPPGRSFHEGTFHGYAQACDAVGDLAWMHAVEAQYGLKDFRNVGNEPWHSQMTEIANSVSKWIADGRPHPTVWKLPSETTPPKPVDDWVTRVIGSMPVMKQGSTEKDDVTRMQHFLVMAGMFKSNAAVDGSFGPQTTEALNDWRQSVGLARTGVCDTTCWNGFMAAGDGIPTLAKGAVGSDVARMQRMLSANGYMDKNNAANFDGRFGSGTEGALKKFQTAKHTMADGQCGPKSWESLLTGKTW